MSDQARDRWLGALALVSAAVALGVLATHLCYAPFDYWNQGRLTPSFSFRYGFPAYAPPDSGAILNTIYGPVTVLSYVPCSLAGDPTTATVAGSALSAMFFALPVLLVAWTAEGWRLRLGLALAAFYLTFATTGLSYSAVRIHADAPALMFGGLAVGLLALELPRPGWPSLALSAACAVASMGAKQSMAPLLLVLPAFAAWRHGRRAAGTYLAGAAVAALFGLALCAALFDLRALAFNTVTVPARGGHERLELAALVRGAQALVKEGAFLLIPLGYCALEGVAAPTVAFALAGAALVPPAVIGRVREGGYDNNFSLTHYFLLLALCHELSARRARHAVLAVLAVLTLAEAPTLMTLPQVAAFLPSNAGEQAYHHARAHPGEVYFPYLPLSTLLAEGRLYHFEEGIADRARCGRAPTIAHFRAHLPPKLALIAWNETANTKDAPVARRMLGDFRHKVELADLPGWQVLGVER